MASFNALDIMRKKRMSDPEAEFDAMMIPYWTNYLSPIDVENLRRIATSKKYAGNMNLKYRMIDNIMKARGFARLNAGTNRIVYKYYDDPRFVAKIAVDPVGMGDNPAEYFNQEYLKPFCAKMFQVTPCGTVGFAERVLPLTSVEEFKLVSEYVFELLYFKIIGKYIIEDVGTKYYMNYGIRKSLGVVLLDYPYVYELDGAKLLCNRILPNGMPCYGEIDYDDGFNNLVCLKCGKVYTAADLKKDNNHNKIVISKGGKRPMNIKIKRGNEIIAQSNQSPFIVKPEKEMKTSTPTETGMKISIRRGDEIITAVDNGKFTVVDGKKVSDDTTSDNKEEVVNETVFNIGDDAPVFEDKAPEGEDSLAELVDVIDDEDGTSDVGEPISEDDMSNTIETDEAKNEEYTPREKVDMPDIPDGVPVPIKAVTSNNNNKQPRKVFISTGSQFIPENDASDY